MMQDLPYLKNPPQMKGILDASAALQFPMGSEPLVGALLSVLAASKPHGRFLELGTGTGIATAWLLQGMDADSSLVSIDTDAMLQKVARDYLGFDHRLTLRTGDALEFLGEQPEASFDLVFADAMPGKYEGLAEALAVIKAGGYYVIDDLLPQANWPEGHAAKIPTLMDELAACANFQIIPLVWSSGVVVAVRK